MNKPMISVPFTHGTRNTAGVPLIDDATGAALVDSEGMTVTIEILWPDHPDVTFARSLWMGHYMKQNRECFTDGPLGEDGKPTRVMRDDVLPEVFAQITENTDRAYRAYAVALVKSWSMPVPCTPEEVDALLTNSPFVLTLIMRATDEHERFLPPSLRTVTGGHDAPSVAPVVPVTDSPG